MGCFCLKGPRAGDINHSAFVILLSCALLSKDNRSIFQTNNCGEVVMTTVRIVNLHHNKSDVFDFVGFDGRIANSLDSSYELIIARKVCASAEPLFSTSLVITPVIRGNGSQLTRQGDLAIFEV